MSVDEDTELRDLVAQTLETNGVLGKIRVRTVYILTVTSSCNLSKTCCNLPNLVTT